MQNNIIWEGINDESLENCNVLTNNNGCQANSTVPVAEEENADNIETMAIINFIVLRDRKMT